MSDAKFWFDQRNAGPGLSANGDPKVVIKGLEGEFPNNNQTRSTLIPLIKIKDKTHIEIGASFALFIRGTSTEIFESLSRELNGGLRYIAIIGAIQRLEMRYIRQKVYGISTKTVTIFGVAADTYWTDAPVARSSEAASKQKPKAWAGVATVGADPYKGGPSAAGIETRDLIQYATDLRDVDAWF